MKKMMFKNIIFIFLLLIVPFNVLASSRNTIKFSSCVDGDTAKFIINNEEEKVRFLAIDTEESVSTTKENTYMGKIASKYTCKRLQESKIIEIEYDDNSNNEDKYGRILGWIFLDGNLFQEELVHEGYAKVAYLYGDYKYTYILKESETYASSNKLGVWKEGYQSTIKSDFNKENSSYETDFFKKIDEILKIWNKIIKMIKKMAKLFT